MKKVCVVLALLLCCSAADAVKWIYTFGDNPPQRAQRVSKLYLHPAPDSLRKGIAVIVCPGGSYVWLSRRTEGSKVADWLNTQGIDAYVLTYRTYLHFHRYPAAMEDVSMAMLYLRHHAAQLGLHSIGVMGFSAGGHLAGALAENYDGTYLSPYGIKVDVPLRPDFAVMLYPVVTMTGAETHLPSRDNLLGAEYKASDADRMSLERHVHPGMPPVFLAACIDDPVVDYHNSVNFKQAMDAHSVPCTFCLYKKGKHGFGASDRKAGREAAQWKISFMKWLKNNDKSL
jgi:acetyl esterase/lipase